MFISVTKKLSLPVLLILVLLLIYLLTWPVQIEPKAWNAPRAPQLNGVYAVNQKLSEFEAISIDGTSGPEAIISDAAGTIYASSHEGWILKLEPGSTQAKRWLQVGGRPLGIAFDQQQNLWVANAYLGLQKITPSGEITVQTDMAESVAIRYADDLVVAPDGMVYFSDASTKFAAMQGSGTLAASLLDLMEHGLHGRIIKFDPHNNTTEVIMRDLSFANGVTVDEAGRFLLIAETGGYRIWKHWLKGEKAGQHEVLVDNLPGFPDNIHRGQGGRYWVGLTSPRSTIMDDLSTKPWLRKVVQRLPSFMRPNVQHYGHVLAIDEHGKVLSSLQDPQGKYPATTGAWETDEYLYISSLIAPVMARIAKPLD